MVFTRLPSSKSSRPFNNPLVIVPKAPITIGIILTFMFHRFFFQFSSKVEVLISLVTFFQFYSVVSRDSKVDNFADFIFLLIIIRSGLLAEIRWSVCISKSHRSLCVCHFLGHVGVVHIPFLSMVKFKCLSHLPVDHLDHPVVSSLVLLLCQVTEVVRYHWDFRTRTFDYSKCLIKLKLVFQTFIFYGLYVGFSETVLSLTTMEM